MILRFPGRLGLVVPLLLACGSRCHATTDGKLVSSKGFQRVVENMDSAESWCPVNYCWSRAWEAGDTIYAAKGMYGRNVLKTWKVARSSLDQAALATLRARISGRDSCRNVLYDRPHAFSDLDSIAFESIFESVELVAVARWPETRTLAENIRLDLAYRKLNAGVWLDDRRRPIVSAGIGLGNLATLAYGHGLASDWSCIRAKISVPGIGIGSIDHDYGWFSLLDFNTALSYRLPPRSGFLYEAGVGIDFAKIRPVLDLGRRQRRVQESEEVDQ